MNFLNLKANLETSSLEDVDRPGIFKVTPWEARCKGEGRKENPDKAGRLAGVTSNFSSDSPVSSVPAGESSGAGL